MFENWFRRTALIYSAAVLFLVSQANAGDVKISMKRLETNSFQDLNEALEKFRTKHKLPALAAAVCSGERVLAAGAVGIRKAGSEEKVDLADKFHIGSCTKSMTSLLAAMMVERGELEWSRSVGQSFPEWKARKPQRSITLEQLLTHRSGIDYNVSDELWAKAWNDLKGTPREQREVFLQEALTEKLKAKPGKKHIYSNTGYALAGAMLEKKRDQGWEDLVRQEIFQPLGMNSAGFGPPSSPSQVDQPWGHQFNKAGEAVPQPAVDNPVSIAPAAAAHCSILDFAQYAAFHLRAVQGKVPWMSKETLKRLYTGVRDNNDHGMGWIVLKRGWAGGRALTHSGSNTIFYAVMWLAPEKDVALVVTLNVGLGEVEEPVVQAGEDVIEHLIFKVAKLSN